MFEKDNLLKSDDDYGKKVFPLSTEESVQIENTGGNEDEEGDGDDDDGNESDENSINLDYEEGDE